MKKDQLNFLEQVLVQARCTDTPYLNSNSLKRLRASLKDNGCTHLLMYDYLNQHDDSQIVPYNTPQISDQRVS